MDREVVWLEAALDDLDQIAAYIAVDSPRYASVVVVKLLALAAELGGAVRLGRMVPEWGEENVRERLVYSYRLIYKCRREAGRYPGSDPCCAAVGGRNS